MIHSKRKLGTLILIANLVAALIWQIVGHAGPLQAAGAHGRSSNGSHSGVLRARSSVTSPVLVGPLLMPDVPDCTPHPTSAAVVPPDSRRVGRLSPVPAGLTQTVSVTFPPCDVPKVAPMSQTPPSEQVSFRVLSQVQYSGSEGTLTVVTAVPSSAAISDGLNLGNRAGNLPDGTPLWSMQFANDGTNFPVNHIEWFEGGHIVELASDMPLDSLESLAANVVVK